MAKTIKFLSGVHLSENFGGIKKHGEDLGPEVKKGTITEIKSDALAAKLIELKLAEPFSVEKK